MFPRSFQMNLYPLLLFPPYFQTILGKLTALCFRQNFQDVTKLLQQTCPTRGVVCSGPHDYKLLSLLCDLSYIFHDSVAQYEHKLHRLYGRLTEGQLVTPH